jgi:hypothetical protein
VNRGSVPQVQAAVLGVNLGAASPNIQPRSARTHSARRCSTETGATLAPGRAPKLSFQLATSSRVPIQARFWLE